MFSEKQEITCYIHNVSPVRKSGRTSYFNYVLQKDSTIQKGVSFNIERREALETLSKQKSPVKISKYKISDKYDRQDIIIHKHTTITPTTATFAYQDQKDVLSISSLGRVASEQLITIKGFLAHLSGTKKVTINGSEVKKQEGYITDPSGFIKVIFWGGHTDNQQQGSTYIFKKIRIRKNQGQTYLNTPKQENECTIEPTQPFEETLCQVDVPTTTNDITASIIGVESVSQNFTCGKCSKRVNIKGKLAICGSCKMTQKKDRCELVWSFKLYVEDKRENKKIHLYAYNQSVVHKIFHIGQLDDSSSEDDILCALLELDCVNISYDTQTSNIIDIEPFNI